ncbi:hypothetical protein L6164_002638 [Bauhinia variegata]|uniref:Uncharacterized protein n=1 Tax=Bauhinia variegata TaxID=167791 RepID=A0ACB9PYP2_BAUVA|nr:hypothetical protein L6164_002638 [Bauhinia variegata]
MSHLGAESIHQLRDGKVILFCLPFLFSLYFLVAQFVVGATPLLLGGKTLKIGIPIKTDFTEFVDVKLNSSNQAIQNQVSGYSIEVFFAAVSYLERHLALNVSFEFEAFVNREGEMAATYNDLLHQIPEKGFALLFMERNANKEAGIEDSPSRKQPPGPSILLLPIAQAVLPEKSVAKKCSRHGSKYMMAGPTYRNVGFGFAFPLGSNLKFYFSRAILNVLEDPTMDKIEETYFGINHDDLQDQYDQISAETPSLTTQSFAGLFIIIGSLIILALLVSESCIWQRPVMVAKTLSKRYLFSSSSKKVNPSVVGSNTNGKCAGSTNGGNNHLERLPRPLSFPL